jgi:hypothetical protein
MAASIRAALYLARTPRHNPRVNRRELASLSRALASGMSTPLEDRSDRRQRGVVFTPAPLAEFVARATLAPLLGIRRPLVVLDPACGDGRFLMAARKVLRGRNPADLLVGIERAPDLAARARELLPEATIHCAEALLAPPAMPAIDAVVGNPPYVRSIRLRAADPVLWSQLRGRYAATSKGEWDLYAAFVEQSLAWTTDGGRVGLVVPSRWLTAAYAGGLRCKLAAERVVESIVDFGADQVFPGATTYASVVVLARPRTRTQVSVARRQAEGWALGAVAPASLGEAPWTFAIGGGSPFARLRGRGPTLGQVVRIAKGAGTNADGVFVIRQAHKVGSLVVGETSTTTIEIEAEATVPCVRGRDVVHWGQLDERQAHTRCIYPYDAHGTLLAASELRRRFPLLARWLSRNRKVLAARERGRFRGAQYYAFGRPQNLGFHRQAAAKVIFPDVVKDARVQLDDGGALVLDTAYALRPLEASRGVFASPHLYLALLGSRVVRSWLDQQGVALRGGYTRMKTAFLAPLPLPPPSKALLACIEAVKAGQPERAEESILRAFGIH